jgi:DNA-binding CsgD family transcriptional regulator
VPRLGFGDPTPTSNEAVSTNLRAYERATSAGSTPNDATAQVCVVAMTGSFTCRPVYYNVSGNTFKGAVSSLAEDISTIVTWPHSEPTWAKTASKKPTTRAGHSISTTLSNTPDADAVNGNGPRPAGPASPPAEIRVAELIKDGLSNADIGRRLLCSARTIQAHLTHIYAKLGLSSRAELAAETTRQQT